ncbi:sigma-70 family RNA polymerase sigma factor [Bordetella bronchiseptica]|uniref:RNA polymerase sigma factor SigJ n=1 Tax=Bordetella genomosp. 6 TaxID=463024 RepID=A0ABX4FH93_9BORD|nr:sigma-70 family RNA polymerase sigma factor [Bordetella genomosp. 6]MBN3269130.1 RNA polymerase sigma factor SigJ [Bordetella bronchiseptica]OZI81580.1 RNA polymerase sigma factor SigJ [Bordetella genomosp. 6]
MSKTAALTTDTPRADDFEPHRRHLYGLAYRMLGSWSEAEDVVQETWLRWREVDPATLDDARAFLSRIATRLCLDVLKSARVRRQVYVGPWLPEPLPDAQAYAGAAPGEIAHDVSVALMLALERLSASERAAFLLHDVFDVPFSEIAGTLGRTEAGCRQLAARARNRVRESRPRFAVEEGEGVRLARAFIDAARHGDVDVLRQLLADDAVLHSDGGGKKLAFMRPILGRASILRAFAGLARKGQSDLSSVRIVQLNGMPAIYGIERDGLPRTISLGICGGRIVRVYIMRNPDKLAHLARLVG